MLDWIIRVFFDIVKICSTTCLPMIFEVLIDEIYRTREGNLQEGSLLIRICRKCVEEYEVVEHATSEQFGNYIRQIEMGLPGKIKS